MKAQLKEDQDGVRLQNLGRASLQIIHDIKNQLNGLKLYATYLRKRMEKSEEPNDLQETVAKLIAGVDRAASDLNVLVQYGQPVSLNALQGTDLQKLMRGVATNWPESTTGESSCAFQIDSDPASLVGEFDATALTDAFNAISAGVLKTCKTDSPQEVKVRIRREVVDTQPMAAIEWSPVSFVNGDPFRSFKGAEAIRMSLAAKIVEAHGGSAEQENDLIRIRLPLTDQ
jgi:light-regulated signal transduction histidine kinase (bacteriophytochrome)